MTTTINPYSGVITPGLKTIFSNAISAMLYDDSCTVPCTLHYGITKYEDCANCVFDPIGNKSANRFQDGGPIPFPFGNICPMCNGGGKRAVESSEDLSLMVIWDQKDFFKVGSVNTPDGDIQTMTFADRTPKLKRAKEIVVATNIAGYATHRFERITDPVPCGLDSDQFVACMWKRIG
jgi:hypothetical protein